ncbi:MAG: helix-turn-helix domain-containing protein [Enterocloster clostridioformis]
MLFEEVSKVTFQDYLMEIRLNHARQLLQIGTYKIKDVAEQSGFSDQHYFSKNI